jgi:hypothetical protein
MNETEISELYNFNYNCVYNNIKNDEEAKSQYKYDLSQIISELDDVNLYHMKLYGIFLILNDNEDAKHIFNLLRKKMPTEFHDENYNNAYYNIRLFCQILSYDFLHLYHPCICDIYHDHVIKTENLNKLLTFLDNITRDI